MLRRTALIVFALFLLAPVLPGQQTALTILAKDSRRTLATSTVNEQDYVALDDLAMAFQLNVREDPLGMLAVTYKGKTILLTPDQPLGSVGGRVISLPAPTIRSNRRWLVPVDFIGRALALVYDSKITLRRPSRMVIVGDLRVPRVQVRYEPSAGSGPARLTIDATPRAASAVTQNGDQLLVIFDADAIDLASTALTGATTQGLIQNVRVVEPTTLAFTTGPRFGTVRVSTQTSDTSTRQTIDIGVTGPAQVEPVDSARDSRQPPPDLSALTSAGTVQPIRTIAIDPGHGGEDEGVKGADGIKEKDVTLAVARKLKAALESKLGVRVLLTRDDDRSVPIDDRTAVANNGKADVFLSLHANASWRPALAGATISTALFEREAELAARSLAPELVPAIGGSVRDVEFVAWDIAQIPHLQQSATLARIMGEQLHEYVPLAGKPVDAAPLRVLEPANMPAVLIEMGYLTNPAQEKQLAGDTFQNALVQGLVEAIMKFRDTMGAAK